MFPWKSPRFCMVLLLLFGSSMSSVSSAEPGDRQDVIQTVALTNERQCHRLCWYRKLCTSFSYLLSSPPAAGNSTDSNCVLHADSVNTSVNTALWVQKPASSSDINNGCNTRPCYDTEVCVPTSSKSDPSHVCLPLPSQCGIPDAVPHGNVNVSGNSQGDIAHVTCDKGYVASPKGVSVELECLITSRWTSFDGTCQRFLYSSREPSYPFPWPLEQNSELCVGGTYISTGQIALDFRKGSITVHVAFKSKGVIHTVYDNRWLPEKSLGSNPLVLGKQFNITVLMLNDTLQLVVDKAITYDINLTDIKGADDNVIDLSTFEELKVSGANADLNLINMIEGC